jgi:hypothetical protein
MRIRSPYASSSTRSASYISLRHNCGVRRIEQMGGGSNSPRSSPVTSPRSPRTAHTTSPRTPPRSSFADPFDELCMDLLELLHDGTYDARQTDEHGIYWPTMVVYERIERFVRNRRNDPEFEFDYYELIGRILESLHTFEKLYRDPGVLKCDYITPEYDGENAGRDYFPEGFVNSHNRNLYTQLFLVLHWDSQTNHGTRAMTEMEIMRDLDDVDVIQYRKSRNIKPYGFGSATFEEYCRLVVWLGQNGTKFASRENGREKKGKLYYAYWLVDAYGV